jgi:hypothetical protein
LIVRTLDTGIEAVTQSLSNTIEFEYIANDNKVTFRDVEIYYPPTSYTKINARAMGLKDVPKVLLDNLEEYDLSYNDFFEMPNLAKYTPALQKLTLESINLNRTDNKAWWQAKNRLPTSLVTMNIRKTWGDKSHIDFSHLTSLTNLNFNSSLNGVERDMDADLAPIPPASIVKAQIQNHQFKYLPIKGTTANSFGWDKCPALEEIYIGSTSIDGSAEYATTGSTSPSDPIGPIVLGTTSPVLNFDDSVNSLRIFSSSYNQHSFVDFSSFTALETITHVHSTANTTNSGNVVSGKLPTTLKTLNCYYTNLTGDLNTTFQNLPSLQTISGYASSFYGGLRQDSFSGSTSITAIYLGGRTSIGNGANDDFFGRDVVGDGGTCFTVLGGTLSTLSIRFSGTGVSGRLPDLSQNSVLTGLYLQGNNLSGTVPTFQDNPVLSTINLSDNALSGTIPTFGGNSLRTVDLTNNNFSGTLSKQEKGTLVTFKAGNNDLSGEIPSWNACPNLVNLELFQNSFTTYKPGTFSTNRDLENVLLNGNGISTFEGQKILEDLEILSKPPNNVRNCTVNLTSQAGLPFTSLNMVQGVTYRISTPGSTDYTALGARDNNVDTEFMCAPEVKVTYEDVQPGVRIVPVSFGDTDWEAIGAPNNTYTLFFTARKAIETTASSFIPKKTFRVTKEGNTDWEYVGRQNNETEFTAIPVLDATDATEGTSYRIRSLGAGTDFTLIGAPRNVVEEAQFTAVATLPATGNINRGDTVTITAPGTTDFTQIGASANEAGQTFTAKNVYGVNSLGTGHDVGDVVEIVDLGNTSQAAWNDFFGTSSRITGATNANPVAVTTDGSHGFTTGDIVTIYGVSGMTEINGTFTVTVTGSNAFTLDGIDGRIIADDPGTPDVDETQTFGTYSSGGTCYATVYAVSDTGNIVTPVSGSGTISPTTTLNIPVGNGRIQGGTFANNISAIGGTGRLDIPTATNFSAAQGFDVTKLGTTGSAGRVFDVNDADAPISASGTGTVRLETPPQKSLSAIGDDPSSGFNYTATVSQADPGQVVDARGGFRRANLSKRYLDIITNLRGKGWKILIDD